MEPRPSLFSFLSGSPRAAPATPRRRDGGPLSLPPGALLTLDGRGELGVVAETDGLWITLDGMPQDWTPRAGDTLRLAGTGCLRISAFVRARLRLDTQGWRWSRGVLVHADGRRERLRAPPRREGPGAPARQGSPWRGWTVGWR